MQLGRNRFGNPPETENRFAHRNGGIGGRSASWGRAMGGATIARVAREENNGRAEFRESCKVCTFVSFFCGASFSDQLRIVAVSADEASPTSTAVELISCKKPGSFWRKVLFSQRMA